MARILLADDGIEFDGKTPQTSPLGGVESSVVALATELAARGHDVFVRNNCGQPLDYKGVHWHPIEDGQPWPDNIDLYIANRGDKLINKMPGAARTVFWIHNPATYLLKWRYQWKLWRKKPAIIFIGDYHKKTYPIYAMGGDRIVIPYGLPDRFCHASKRPTPDAKAIFTSNPLRSLDWLLDRWQYDIQPHVPHANLHLFAGSTTYGHVGEGKKSAMDVVLDKAQRLKNKGVILRGPVDKQTLIDELETSRIMIYRGDINETFCLAVGEAQALGVPTVVQNLGSVVERVKHDLTGYVAENDDAFSAAAIKLLKDDDLWQRQHQAALDQQRHWRWADAAAEFEKLITMPKGGE